MNIKKVDDKPMVIHTKEKAKLHMHESKKAEIKASNIYTVCRGPDVGKTSTGKSRSSTISLFANVVFIKPLLGSHTFRSLQALIDDVFPILFANLVCTLVHLI